MGESNFPDIGCPGDPGWPGKTVLAVVPAVGVDHLVRVGDQPDTGTEEKSIFLK